MIKIKAKNGSYVGQKLIGKQMFYLQLHITEKCNLRCKHCYEGCSEIHNSELLTPTEIKELICNYQNFIDLYDFRGKIYFTGGEPLLNSNLCSYISLANQLGMCTMVLSNGTLVDSNKAMNLKNAGLKIIQVSIDGIESTHDDLRGKGSFEKSMKALDYCNEVGLITTVMFTLSKLNMDQFEIVIKDCISHHVNRFSFGRLVPTGNGLDLMNQVLSKEELKVMFKKIKKIQKKYQDKIVLAFHDPLWLTYNGVQNICGCSAGNYGICIIENGDIMPCRRLDLSIGNIRQNSLENIWNSPYLKHFRDRDIYDGKCKNCKFLEKCGGCRAIARFLGSSEFGEDPQCFIRK